jgi:hypothetical protein
VKARMDRTILEICATRTIHIQASLLTSNPQPAESLAIH